MPRIELTKDESWRYQIVPTWIDRMTDFLLWRYVRFAMLGVSLIAGVCAMLGSFKAVIDNDLLWWAIQFLFGLANCFIFGWNLRRYKRDFWK